MTRIFGLRSTFWPERMEQERAASGAPASDRPALTTSTLTKRLAESWRLTPRITLEMANSIAWHEGKRLLERAIERKLDLAFETTLGGNTIAALLRRAAEAGLDVRVWYAGLSSPELHIARVRARVAKGGHDIPESKIRERYEQSRANLIQLLPWLASLRLYDNSEEGDPATVGPNPELILHLDEGRIVQVLPLAEVPRWAEPIVAAALGRNPV